MQLLTNRMKVQVWRFSVVSRRPFEEAVRRLTTTIGRPDILAFHNAVASGTDFADLERVVHEAIGPSELMEFARYDAGEILGKERGGPGPKSLRLVVGNPASKYKNMNPALLPSPLRTFAL